MTAAADLTFFLGGDVMLGRGIDQLLPHPVPPHLYEPYVRSALDYVELAERATGPLPRPVDFGYVWGDALEELRSRAPQARIVNLETAVTLSEDAWPGKGIHYRMHPRNAPCLAAAGIDCCVLANNHVLDWGHAGLAETIATLQRAGLRTAGAGRDAEEAAAPAVIEWAAGGRLLVFACATHDCGVPPGWAAGPQQPGVNLLADLSRQSCDAIARQVAAARRPGDCVVVSIHWGGNWGHGVSREERAFAHRLIDAGAADVLHGHSSHHPRGMELYRGRAILYGCGDLINDYEGIGGHEAWRPELCLMVFVTLAGDRGGVRELSLVPMRMRRFRLQRASDEEAAWLARTLDRESRGLGARVELASARELLVSASAA
jgi:poly-gamma-glutamate capsule biosynthesis protein CapA/YwtB (metallophosphatase superfamily)